MLKFYAGGGFIFILIILGIILKKKEKHQKNKPQIFKEFDYECHWGQYVEIDSE